MPAPPRDYLYPSLSPAGDKAAVTSEDDDQDIWIWDFSRETLTRFTLHAGIDMYSIWTSDDRLIFSSGRDGTSDVYIAAADATGEVTRLTDSPRALYPSSLSHDGEHLVVRAGINAEMDLGVMSLDGGEPEFLLASEFDELNGDISPDGRWLAYQSNESGRFEIYVKPFPDVDSGRWTISTSGGREPLWSPDGKELFYRTPENRGIMAVAMSGAPDEAGNPELLFAGDYLGRTGRSWDIHPDGRRFLMIKPVGSTTADDSPRNDVILVQNWLEELERLVPHD